MSAIEEGIAVTAILRVPHLGQASGARGHVRRDEHSPADGSIAALDKKSVFAANRLTFPVQPGNPGERRRACGQLLEEGIETRFVPFDLDEDGAVLILDRAAQMQPGRQAMHERSEADTLHNAMNGDSSSFHISPSSGNRVVNLHPEMAA